MNCKLLENKGNIFIMFLLFSILIVAIRGRSIKQDGKYYLIETDMENINEDTANKVDVEKKGEDL